MSNRQPVSMQDVARRAGVSPQTVSRVANMSEAVRSTTRMRVEEAMQELGYRPNYAARALKQGRFEDVGVVLFSMSRYGNARILNGISSAAFDDDYAVTLQIMSDDKSHPVQSAIDRMKRLPVDGVIVILEENVSDFAQYQPTEDFPVVLVSEEPADFCPTIDADQYGCSTVVVDYLLSKGHRTVYHVAGPTSSRAAQSRASGWRDSLRQLGLRVPSMIIGDWEADSGYQAGLKLAHDPECTAIYASNDQMAYGVIRGLEVEGRQVPRDVSVVGVDDSLVGMIPKLELTTMRMKFDEIGRESFSMLRRQLTGEKLPTGVKEVIPAELIERGSVRDLTAAG